MVSRLARGVLPANTSIQKDALLALTKSATVFISYLASNANEVTTKRTISPADVLKALGEIEMDGLMDVGKQGPNGEILGRLERELEVFENTVRGKRKGYRDKIKQRESDATVKMTDAEGEGEPETKRVRMDNEGHQNDENQANPQSPRSTLTANGHAGVSGATAGGKTFSQHRQAVDDDDTEDDLEHDDHEDEEPEEGDDQDDGLDENENEDGTDPETEQRLDEDMDPDDYGPNEQLRYEIANGNVGASEDESD